MPASGTPQLRTETSAERVSGIDSLRALAATAVFFCHLVWYWNLYGGLPRQLGNLTDTGAHGVDLFVVISGLCLALPTTDPARSFDTGQFWKRRALRLLPPYYVALAFAAVIAMDANTWSRIVGQRASVGDLAVHVGLAQTIVPGRSGTINGSLWSIALEAQLYLLFPLLLIIWHRAGATRLLLACSILSVAWLSLGQAGAPDPWGSGFLLPARLVQFTAGMVCAGVLRSGWRPARSHAIAVAAAGLVAAISVSTLELNVIVPLVWIVPSIALVFLATNLDEARGWARATKWLGTVSFSFYLIHQPVQLLLNKPFHQLTENAWALLALGSTAAFAMVLVPAVALHRFVEAPSQRRARNSKPTTLKIRGPREVATALPLGAAT